MNKLKLSGLLLVVAFAAEAAGVVRANHAAKKVIVNLRTRNRDLELAGIAMAETLDDIDNGLEPQVALQQFDEKRQFIDMVHHSL